MPPSSEGARAERLHEEGDPSSPAAPRNDGVPETAPLPAALSKLKQALPAGKNGREGEVSSPVNPLFSLLYLFSVSFISLSLVSISISISISSLFFFSLLFSSLRCKAVTQASRSRHMGVTPASLCADGVTHEAAFSLAFALALHSRERCVEAVSEPVFATASGK